MKRDLETENLELATRAWRNQVETLICLIEELLPLAALAACMPPNSRRKTFDDAAKMVDEYRKKHPKPSDPQSPSGVGKRA